MELVICAEQVYMQGTQETGKGGLKVTAAPTLDFQCSFPPEFPFFQTSPCVEEVGKEAIDSLGFGLD